MGLMAHPPPPLSAHLCAVAPRPTNVGERVGVHEDAVAVMVSFSLPNNRHNRFLSYVVTVEEGEERP